MYCPSCGSTNPDGLNFCTRCGTNLGVVSDALSGRRDTSFEGDERSIALLKDYYRSRRMMIIGAAASALSLFKLAGPFLLGFPEKLIPVVILSLAFLLLSLTAFIWGLVKWNNSASEMKALGISPSRGKRPGLPVETARFLAEPLVTTDKTSVTEHTTHLLDNEDTASSKANVSESR